MWLRTSSLNWPPGKGRGSIYVLKALSISGVTALDKHYLSPGSAYLPSGAEMPWCPSHCSFQFGYAYLGFPCSSYSYVSVIWCLSQVSWVTACRLQCRRTDILEELSHAAKWSWDLILGCWQCHDKNSQMRKKAVYLNAVSSNWKFLEIICSALFRHVTIY